MLLSGGLDSAVALAAMKRDGFACHALSFDYGQRHRTELAAADRVARSLGAASHRVVSVDLRAIGGSALTDDIPVPKDTLGSSSEIPITYVPGRNLIFLSIAIGYAETLGAWDVAYGANALDYSGYPDCRPAFVEAFVQAANAGTQAGDEGGRFKVHTPLIELTKARIIRLGAELGVDLSLTHSCYDPDESGAACARCDSCVLRARGFAQAGVPDPTRYAGAAARS